jgi:hypothetical protein
MSPSQVSAEEFERWLAHGLGRPILFLRDHDAAPYREVILDACLHNRCYDWQTEGSRADYMLAIAKVTGTLEFFSDRVIESLSEPVEHVPDMAQRFHYACLLAEDGDERARCAMYESFKADPFDVAAAQQFVELDGRSGFLFVAEKLGQRNIANPNWDGWHFQSWAEEILGDAKTREAFDRAAESNPAIENFKQIFQKLTRDKQDWNSSISTPNLSYDQIQQLIHEYGPRKNHRSWGRNASDSDLARAAQDLVDEQDPERLKAYLSIFADRPFPLGPDALLKVIESYAGTRIVFLALKALAKLSHPDIRKLAFNLIESGDVDRRCAIELLTNSAEPGDGVIVESWCMAEQDDEALHGMAPDSMEYLDKHPDDAARVRLLTSYYDRVACAFCRSRWVKKLISLDALTEQMREELPHDSYDECRALV